ncbi:MAG: (2Fe-2S)-binding protein [Prevotellaceae bacterium]|jgi:predicted molibdopterin-dependent oxidoreductase YjgC|nr:(2Fe-2S)-binding protein [Prevotellaceae bacterium]
MIITINNTQINALEGETILRAAHRNGMEVPALCYTPDHKHQSSCMICVVKNCQTGQMIPSCSTVTTDGMIIDSESDEVKDLRRQSLELLLSDHIAVCRPPCNINSCKLRQYAITYRAKWNRYPRYSAIKATQPQHIKDNFWFDVSKCIRCGLCVYNSTDGFTFKGRGFGMQVVLPNESVHNVDESLCQICPTQALYISHNEKL